MNWDEIAGLIHQAAADACQDAAQAVADRAAALAPVDPGALAASITVVRIDDLTADVTIDPTVTRRRDDGTVARPANYALDVEALEPFLVVAATSSSADVAAAFERRLEERMAQLQ